MSSAATCDAQVGHSYIGSIRAARQPLCSGDSGGIFLSSVPDQGCRCSSCRAKLTTLERASLRWDYPSPTPTLRATVACTRVPPRPNDWPCTGDCADGPGVLTRSDRGFGLALQASAYGNEACESRVRETTLLVVNARHEYLDNVYHSFEEVFALLETAEALGEDLSAMRLVFANTNKRKRVSRGPLTLFQLHGGPPVGAPPAGARPPMVELFAALLGRESRGLAPITLDAGAPPCALTAWCCRCARARALYSRGRGAPRRLRGGQRARVRRGPRRPQRVWRGGRSSELDAT